MYGYASQLEGGRIPATNSPSSTAGETRSELYATRDASVVALESSLTAIGAESVTLSGDRV